MARTVTLSDMRTRVRQRADMVNSTFVTDAEVNQFINDAIAELYDLLMQKFGDDYFTVSGPETSFVTNQLDYALPDDFLKEVGVDLKIDSQNWVTLKPFMFTERNRFNNILSRGVLAYNTTYYKLVGNNLQFTQIPGNNTKFRLWYIPYQPVLVSDSDTFDGFNGWEKYPEIVAAITCLNKEESDTVSLERELGRILKRVEDASQNRQAGMGYRVTDVRNITNDEVGIFNR